MALIIKAYNPSRCGDCDLCELYTDMMTEESCYKCVVTTNVVDTEKKHYTCPIIGEIPDSHGRIIVADKLLEKLEKIVLPDDLAHTIARGIMKQIVEDATTIVEASE